MAKEPKRETHMPEEGTPPIIEGWFWHQKGKPSFKYNSCLSYFIQIRQPKNWQNFLGGEKVKKK